MDLNDHAKDPKKAREAIQALYQRRSWNTVHLTKKRL